MAVEEEPVEIDCHAGASAGSPYQSETSTPTVRGGGDLPLIPATLAVPPVAVVRATHVEVPSAPVTHVAPPVTAARAIVMEPPVKRTASGTKFDTAQSSMLLQGLEIMPMI